MVALWVLCNTNQIITTLGWYYIHQCARQNWGEDMAFWKKKDNDDEEKCPLCSTIVSIDDIECPLCFYELKLSPRHQSLNITATEEDSLIGLLNADVEEEEDEEILEVEDVMNLDAQEITVEAQYDDDEFISIPSEHAPEFVTSRMTPSGVVETDAEPKEIVDDDDDEIDLGGISIPQPPSHEDIEYEEVPTESKSELEPVEVVSNNSIPVELPPAPAELPPPPAPAEINASPYVVEEAPPVNVAPENTLNEGLIWPWPPKGEWDSKNLRTKLLSAMAAAKNGDNTTVENTLEEIGPHLGNNIDLLFHIGVLLKRLGRDYELIQMLTKAQVQYPNNSEVVNAVSKLT